VWKEKNVLISTSVSVFEWMDWAKGKKIHTEWCSNRHSNGDPQI